jgi:ribosome-associated protein
MDVNQLKDIAYEALDEMKGGDIYVLDVRGKSSVTDFMVIATGNTDRQVKSLAGNVVDKVKEHGVRPLGTEGETQGEWILVDIGDVVVHVMLPRVRDFYNLEKLWEVDETDSSEGKSADYP